MSLIFIFYKYKFAKQKRHCKMIKQSIIFRLFYCKLIAGRKTIGKNFAR